MNDLGPRIVITKGDVHCTNTLHSVRFSSNLSYNERLIVGLSMITSFGQLAAEYVGRPYGGGVLKFELADARRFPILFRQGIEAESAYASADDAIRLGAVDRARRIADEFLLPETLGASWETAAAEMTKETLQMRAVRRVGGR